MNIDIDHVAKLAKLALTQAERATLSQELPAILDYVARQTDVDTAGVDPKAYLTSATNVFRDDVPAADLCARDALIAMFPKRTGDALDVPGVFAGDL